MRAKKNQFLFHSLQEGQLDGTLLRLSLLTHWYDSLAANPIVLLAWDARVMYPAHSNQPSTRD